MIWLPMLSVLVQVTLIAVLGLLAAGLLRSAAYRHSVLLAVLLCILAAPLFYVGTAWTGLSIDVAAVWPAARDSEQAAFRPTVANPGPQADADQNFSEFALKSPKVAFQDVPVFPVESPPEPFAEEVQRRSADPATYLQADGLIAGIWLVGTLFSLLGVMRSQLKTNGILRGARPAERGIAPEIVTKAEQTLNASDRLRIATTGKVAGPVVVGVFQPWILIPIRYLETLSHEELLQVLIHEGAHALRRDPLVALLQRLGSALFWWHPLVHVVNLELTRAREEVCDNFVLTCTEAVTYGTTLLRLATLSPAMAQIHLTIGIFDSRGKLENRVERLLDARRIIMTRVGFATGATVLVAFGLFSVLVAATRVGAENPAAPPTNEVEPKSALEGKPKIESGTGASPESSAYEKAIDQVVKKLSADGEWTNGRTPHIDLPADAKQTDVIAEAVKKHAAVRDGKPYGVLHVKTVKFAPPIGSVSAALIQKDAGTRVLVFYPFQGVKGWWTRFYTSDFVQPKTASAASVQRHAAYTKAIDQLVSKLAVGHLWMNGRVPAIDLPADAKPAEVIAEALRKQDSPVAVQPYRILHIQEIKSESQFKNASAALIQNEAGVQVLIWFWVGNPRGWNWWNRFYEVKLPPEALESFAAGDEEFAEIVDRLNTNRRGWNLNGRLDTVKLPKDAAANDVIKAALKITNSPFNEIKSSRIVSVRKLEKLVAPGTIPWSGALLDTNLGQRVLIWGYLNDEAGWWPVLLDPLSFATPAELKPREG